MLVVLAVLYAQTYLNMVGIYICVDGEFLSLYWGLLTVNPSIMRYRRNLYIFFIALATCLLKLMFSYEFIFANMISMMPYLLYAIINKMSIKEMIHMFVYLFFGAIFLFVVALGIHSIQNYIVYPDSSKSLKMGSYSVIGRTAI